MKNKIEYKWEYLMFRKRKLIECGLLGGGIAETGLMLPAPVGVKMGVDPTAIKDAIIVGGSCLGTSKPRIFKFTNLHAILNSLIFIFPS